MFVPDNILIDYVKAYDTPYGKKMADANLIPGKDQLYAPIQCLISTFIMQEKRKEKNSLFFNYIEILPDVKNFPILFNKDEILYLKGSPFMETLNHEIFKFKDDYQTIIQKIPGYDSEFYYEEYLKTKLLVQSRVFGVIRNGEEINIMVPFGDMVNAQYEKNARWNYDNYRKGFKIKAKQYIKRGEEIFLTYGQKSNSNWFLYYAYVPPVGNDENNIFPITIEMEVENNQVLETQKNDQLQENKDVVKQTFNVIADIQHQSVKDLLSWARFVQYDGDLTILNDILQESKAKALNEKWADSQALKDKFILDIIDFESEAAAWELIRREAQKAIDKYDSTYEEDLEFKASPQFLEISFNKQQCITFRLAEKKILQFLINGAKGVEMMKGQDQKSAINIIVKNYKTFKGTIGYIKNNIIPLLPKQQKEEL